MRFGILGDIHGDFATVRSVMARHPDVPFWLSVGDVASDDGRYEAPPAPLHFIKGNNENFDLVARGADGTPIVPNLSYLPNAVLRHIGPLTVVGLGGTFAPKWYETPAAGLPHAKPVARRSAAPGKIGALRDDKRRHFVREEIEACKRMRGVDVFLSHEAPRPYLVGGAGGRRIDAGKTPVNEVLAAMRPRVHFFGHHHRFTEAVRQHVPSIGLEPVSVSYLLVDLASLAYERLPS